MNQQIFMLETAARVLSQVPVTIVFTGGATISLYLDEVAAPDIRPTDDVDCVVEITSKAEYYHFSNLLRILGLQETTESGAPLCRWQYEGISIDVMPCDESVLGFSNRWYKPGIANSIYYQLPSGRQILIFSTPYLLASKIEAFTGRGGDNFYFSSDIEDIVAVLDGRSNLFEEVQQANGEVKAFLSEWFRAELENLCEIAPAFLSPAARNSGRARLVLQTIERLAISVDY
ncbi:hypothetical protein [Microcoleus sp. herbarium12]|jgi:hypothetical protein|uniref:hypothetical protein n=1 Tax=Microcoleus sp. herbarium12 TaxID=3055437 RepID=UPI002FD517E7